MAVTFLKKHHTCTSCGYVSYELIAIKSNNDIQAFYTKDRIPEVLKEGGIYIEHIERDEYGIVVYREAIEKPCENCGQLALSSNKVDNEIPVLNFYPRTEAHKWLDGLGKAGL